MAIERTEGCRGNRGLLRKQRSIERIEGRRGDKGLLREQSAIEGTSEHTYSDNHFTMTAIIALVYFFGKIVIIVIKAFFSRKSIIVWSHFFCEKRSKMIIIVNPR